MKIHALASFCLALTGTAAAPATEPAGSAPVPVPETAAVSVEIPLLFIANGHTLPVPLVAGRIDGRETLLLLDTGSTDNALTQEFAAAHDLTGSALPSGTDHAGARVTVQSAKAVTWQLGDFQRSVSDPVVVPGPAPFVALGIGGFVSPQRLFGSGTVVLDFASSHLVVLPGGGEAVQGWLEKRFPGATRTDLPRAHGPDGWKPYVLATLNTAKPVLAMLDTGGSVSEADEPLLPAEAHPAGVGFSISLSGKQAARTVDGQRLGLGSLSFGPMKLKARQHHGGISILIGMDVLRGMILVIPSDPHAPYQLWRPAGR